MELNGVRMFNVVFFLKKSVKIIFLLKSIKNKECSSKHIEVRKDKEK